MQVMLRQVGSLADDSGRCVAMMDVWVMPAMLVQGRWVRKPRLWMLNSVCGDGGMKEVCWQADTVDEGGFAKQVSGDDRGHDCGC